jgi:hypothetical protein
VLRRKLIARLSPPSRAGVVVLEGQRHLQPLLERGRAHPRCRDRCAERPARIAGIDAGDASQAAPAFSAGVDIGGAGTPAAPITCPA